MYVFNGMSKDIGDRASERSKYKSRTDISEKNKQVFENIDMTNQRHGCWKSREQYMGVSLPQIRGGMGPNWRMKQLRSLERRKTGALLALTS